jgi:glycosyltransferase involved in cell wall biosynthesis
MRVLILASSFHPVIGGAETYIHEVAVGLAQAGHRPLVVTDVPRGFAPGDAFDDPPGVEVRRLHRYRDILASDSKILWEELAHGLHPELAQCLEEWRPDLVFTNSLGTSFAGKTLSLAAGVPWAAAFHEQEPEVAPLGHARLGLVYGVLKPELVLAGSEFYADRAARWGSGANTTVIHHGVDTDLFHPNGDGAPVRRRYGIPDDATLIVSAGRLKERKGHLETIRAFAQVRRERPDCRLLIVGSVSSASLEYARLLEQEIDRSGLKDAVVIDRDVTFQTMPGVYAAADIVAQPSHAEGLGIAVLEAMSSGRAVVTTDVSGIREVLGPPDIAEVVPARTVAPLADALLRLVLDPDMRAHLGRRARDHVRARFCRRTMIAATEAALAALVQARPLTEPLGAPLATA